MSQLLLLSRPFAHKSFALINKVEEGGFCFQNYKYNTNFHNKIDIFLSQYLKFYITIMHINI